MKKHAAMIATWRRGRPSVPLVDDSGVHHEQVSAMDDEALAKRLQRRYGMARDDAMQLVRQFGEHL